MNKIDVKVRDKSGIYLIVNLENGKRYVGSSREIYGRLHDHWHNLKNNVAHNAHLQAAWNKYGEDSFIWSILEYCDESIRFNREQYYIDALKPEYNLTTNVVANFGHTPSQSCREKISNTLKRRYAAGEIQTYRQNHNWVKCYVYDINSFKLVSEYDCLADASKALGTRNGSTKIATRGIILNKYVISLTKLKDIVDIKNYIYQRFTVNGRWLISEVDSKITYHRSVTECASTYGISRSVIMKYSNKNTFYTPTKAPHVKICYLDKFIPITGDAVSIEEFLKLSQIKNGEGWNADAVVNVESKESTSPYSVEIEPEKSE